MISTFFVVALGVNLAFLIFTTEATIREKHSEWSVYNHLYQDIITDALWFDRKYLCVYCDLCEQIKGTAHCMYYRKCTIGLILKFNILLISNNPPTQVAANYMMCFYRHEGHGLETDIARGKPHAISVSWLCPSCNISHCVLLKHTVYYILYTI